MVYSVKISELPVRNNVVGTDLVPVVDAAETQTSTVTAAQIAAIGGGPPGDLTVTTAKIVDKAVTYPKIQDTTTTDVLIGRSSPGGGTVQEIPCTPFARSLLTSADAAAARTTLNALASTASPVFTGQIKTDFGTAAAPAYTFTLDPTTGIFGGASTLSFSTDGAERFRFDALGNMLSQIDGNGSLKPAFPVRAWVKFDGTVGVAQTIIGHTTLVNRYASQGISLNGVANSISSASIARVTTLEASLYNNTLTSWTTVSSNGASNYSSPSNNKHWSWTGSAWTQLSAVGQTWIGRITVTTANPTTIIDGGNVLSVQRITTGTYRVRFVDAMPDGNYTVIGSTTLRSSPAPAAWGFVSVGTVVNNEFDVVCVDSSGTVFDAPQVYIAVIR